MITSMQTFQIAGRGTVKAVRLSDLDRDYHVGDSIELDGDLWVIRRIEMKSPCRPEDHIGIVVRRLIPHVRECKLGLALSPVAIECEHGSDVCSICDPCTCPNTVEATS